MISNFLKQFSYSWLFQLKLGLKQVLCSLHSYPKNIFLLSSGFLDQVQNAFGLITSIIFCILSSSHWHWMFSMFYTLMQVSTWHLIENCKIAFTLFSLFPHGRPPSRRISRCVMKELERDERNVFLTHDWDCIIQVKDRKEIQTHLQELKSFWSLFFRRYLKWQLHLIQSIAVKSVWDGRSVLVSRINFYLLWLQQCKKLFTLRLCVLCSPSGLNHLEKLSWKERVYYPCLWSLENCPPVLHDSKSGWISLTQSPLKSFRLFLVFY